MSITQSQKIKKRRSLKRPDPKKGREVDPKNILPISIDQSELDGIMKRIALGEEANPQEAFSKIYALALNSIADTLKSALLSFVENIAHTEDVPVFIEKLIPQSKDPEALKRTAASLSDAIDRSRDKIQDSLRHETRKTSYDNYDDYTAMLRRNNLFQPVSKDTPEEPNLPSIPYGHITAERLREICDDVRTYKPSKTDSDTFRIDLNRLNRKRTMNFDIHADSKDQTSAEASVAQDDEATREENEAAKSIIENAVAEFQTTVEHEKEEAAKTAKVLQDTEDGVLEIIRNAQASAESNNAQEGSQPLAESIETVNQIAEQLPTLFEQAILSATRSEASNNASATPSDEALSKLKTFGVEFAETFEGITAMMTEFANQLSAAIIEDQAYKLPTLSQALGDDPRLKEDTDLMNFVSFLESDEPSSAAENPSPEDDDLSNDILSEAFGALLDQLDD